MDIFDHIPELPDARRKKEQERESRMLRKLEVLAHQSGFYTAFAGLKGYYSEGNPFSQYPIIIAQTPPQFTDLDSGDLRGYYFENGLVYRVGGEVSTNQMDFTATYDHSGSTLFHKLVCATFGRLFFEKGERMWELPDEFAHTFKGVSLDGRKFTGVWNGRIEDADIAWDGEYDILPDLKVGVSA
ncbi:hypothetical protein GOV09_05005 [Candidatus Woesearchaeota archaeon]|nr:hypothetical protein [Candidatus Woesearchaeota archaeon]